MDEAERVEALAAILNEYDLDAIKIREGELEIELIRRSPAPAMPMSVAYAPPSSVIEVVEGAEGGSAPKASANVKKITAPVVGIFYRSGAPGEEPFVEVGDRVEAGDTVCILEAMKIFNEITSDYSGVVTRIVAQNAELVAVGDELFWIEP